MFQNPMYPGMQNPYMSMPTGTQPYGVPMNTFNYNPQQYSQPQTQVNTNKVYVSGSEDAKNRYLAPNSDYIFLDNDKPLLYRKVVDATGKMEMQTFQIIPYEDKSTEQVNNVDVSKFVSIDAFNTLKKEFEDFKHQVNDLDCKE